MSQIKSGRKGPQADDTVKGAIQFRAGGSAFVVVDGKRDEPSIQISPDDTDVALPGDTVAVRIYRGVEGRRPGERVGRVTQVLERGFVVGATRLADVADPLTHLLRLVRDVAAGHDC